VDRKTLPPFGFPECDRRVRLAHQPSLAGAHLARNGLLKKRQKKYQSKQNLAHIKAQWALFRQSGTDTKDLENIPRYWRQAQRLHLRVVQYTLAKSAVDCCSGLRASAQLLGQRGVRFAHSASSGSLRHLAGRSGLAGRQRRRVPGRLTQDSRRQLACARPAGRPHLPE